MNKVVISGTAVHTPDDIVTNEELVATYNQYVKKFNQEHAEAIAAAATEALQESSCDFIEKASGIKQRYVISKKGMLDVNVMHPLMAERSDDEMSVQCEFAYKAALKVMERAGKQPKDIDAVYMACSNFQRFYPSISVEIQKALGIQGFALDLNMACSSATFGLQAAYDTIRSGSAKCILMVNPEICSGHMNYRDRQSHFIFGDVCTAQIVETAETATSDHVFQMIDTKLFTDFSNNIRNNFGYLNRSSPETQFSEDKLFKQNGRKVFKEVIIAVVSLLEKQLKRLNLQPDDIKRMWLHQANLNMNRMIAEKILGQSEQQGLDKLRWPTVLEEFANTSSAGSIIAFHRYHEDLGSGDIGVLCSFGAGYSIGSLILQKM